MNRQFLCRHFSDNETRAESLPSHPIHGHGFDVGKITYGGTKNCKEVFTTMFCGNRKRMVMSHSWEQEANSIFLDVIPSSF